MVGGCLGLGLLGGNGKWLLMGAGAVLEAIKMSKVDCSYGCRTLQIH